MRVVTMLALCGAAAPAGGCAMGGAMHQATLVGQCAENDAACSRRHPLAPLALGARFHPDVSAEIAGTSTPSLRLESAAPDILSVEAGDLVAKQPGAAAVLISTDDGSVVDFEHVWVAPVTHITLSRRDRERVEGSLGLAVGEDVTIDPRCGTARSGYRATRMCSGRSATTTRSRCCVTVRPAAAASRPARRATR